MHLDTFCLKFFILYDSMKKVLVTRAKKTAFCLIFFTMHLPLYHIKVKFLWMSPVLMLELAKSSPETITGMGVDFSDLHLLTAGAPFNADNSDSIVKKTGLPAFRQTCSSISSCFCIKHIVKVKGKEKTGCQAAQGYF